MTRGKISQIDEAMQKQSADACRKFCKDHGFKSLKEFEDK